MADNFLMKGKVWTDRKHLVKYPVSVEVKYDEIRLHVKREGDKVHFLSYDGNQLFNLESWHDKFHDAMVEAQAFHFDMGVLVNKNFNDSYRWCRSKSGHPKEKLDKKTGKVSPALVPEMVEFYLFDLPESKLGYLDRAKDRSAVVDILSGCGIPTSKPIAKLCQSEEEVDQAFSTYRADGHEGAMVKSLSHTYEIGKRIDGWLKMKPEAEADGVVTAIHEAISEEGVPLGRAGAVSMTMEDGSTAKPAANSMGHELAALVFNHQADYIGEWASMTYMERDRSGGYRHPIFGRFRERKG